MTILVTALAASTTTVLAQFHARCEFPIGLLYTLDVQHAKQLSFHYVIII